MLGSFFTNVWVVVVVLGVMIFVHELGHFLAAKAFGVRVLVFSLGFGKSLLHLKRGDTDYRISALPFGGYVKMAGDDPSAVREGDTGEYLSQPRWRRFVIVVMGPAMNVMLAIILAAGVYKVHFERPAYLEQSARIGDVEPGSPAERAGIQPNDLILRFANRENPKWEDIDFKVATSVDESIPLVLERGAEIVKTTISPVAKGPSRVGYAGWDPVAPGVLASVEPGLPASKAGLQPGDTIVGVDGRRVDFFPDIASIIQTGDGKPVVFDVVRAGKQFQATVQPVYEAVKGDPEKHWRVGLSFHTAMIVRRLPLKEALATSISDNARNCLVTFDVLGKILTGRMSARSLTGPIGIGQFAGEAYREGFYDLLVFVAAISLQLGIFNLLPIPVLDGGVILMLLVEGVIGRDLSLQVKERFLQVGIVFLLLLAAFVMYNDLVKTLRPS